MLKIEQEEKEEKKTSVDSSYITVCTTVLKKEEGKYCFDFVLRKGEKEVFYQHYQYLVNDKEKLWPYLDAEIQEKIEEKQ